MKIKKKIHDRAAIQLVLCQHIKEMDDEELETAFMEATGEALEKVRVDDDGCCWYSDCSLPSLVEAPVALDIWLDQMLEVCRQRLAGIE